MTGRVVSLSRVVPSLPCGSGTDPGTVTEACGRADTRLYACGWRCGSHRPRPGATAAGSIFDVPVRQVA